MRQLTSLVYGDGGVSSINTSDSSDSSEAAAHYEANRLPFVSPEVRELAFTGRDIPAMELRGMPLLTTLDLDPSRHLHEFLAKPADIPKLSHLQMLKKLYLSDCDWCNTDAASSVLGFFTCLERLQWTPFKTTDSARLFSEGVSPAWPPMGLLPEMSSAQPATQAMYKQDWRQRRTRT